MSLLRLLARVGRVAPAFAVLAIFSCLLALTAGIPRGQMAVTAAVPLVGAFLLMKAITLSLPEPDRVMHEDARRRAPDSIWHIGKFAIIFTLLVAVWLFSGVVFLYLDLPVQRTTAFHLAAWTGIAALLCMLALVVIAMRSVIRSWGDVCLREIANIARYPLRFVECLPKAGGVRLLR